MPELLPTPRPLRISQHPGRVDKTALAKPDQLLIVVPDRVSDAIWRSLPDGTNLRALARRLGKKAHIRYRLSNRAATGVVVVRLPASGDRSSFARLDFARRAISSALEDRPRSLGIYITGCDDAAAEATTRALTLAAGAAAWTPPNFRSKPEPGPKLQSLRLYGLHQRLDLTRELAEIDAANLARRLTAMPANMLDSRGYRQAILTLAKTHGWRHEFFGIEKLAKLGAGAFLAVAQGNAGNDAGIVRLRYRPDGAAARPAVALVGKGIVFDTGGNNLKPFKAMLNMHEDMGGSAVALATLQALTELGYPHGVDCWLAITENSIDAAAYKPQDVVTASNGTTIEVIHTDAEGRMVLADALALAGRERPAMIVDFATLTGSCITALTERYSGIFTNRTALNPLLIDTGHAAGERVWPFPMDADYDDALKSKVADTTQCSPDDDGDHILAARFLQRFVPDDSHWVHLDLGAVTSKKGLAQVPPGPTGFGVRYTLNLLLDQAARFEQAVAAQ